MFSQNKKRNYESLGDSPLLEKWLEGDKIAGGVLYLRYHNVALAFSLGRLSTRDEGKEVVADTFYRITLHIEKGGKIRNFKQYLFASLRHRISQKWKQEGQHRKKIKTLPITHIVEAHEEFENEDFLQRLTEDLTENQRVCIELRLQGYNYQEIADRTQLTTVQVRGYLERARKSIRETVSSQKKIS